MALLATVLQEILGRRIALCQCAACLAAFSKFPTHSPMSTLSIMRVWRSASTHIKASN